MCGGSLPREMGVPKEGASLVRHAEVVGVSLPSFYGALGYVGRSIRPCRPVLPYAMPMPKMTTSTPPPSLTFVSFSK